MKRRRRRREEKGEGGGDKRHNFYIGLFTLATWLRTTLRLARDRKAPGKRAAYNGQRRTGGMLYGLREREAGRLPLCDMCTRGDHSIVS
jgi:hypothetical protein